MPTIQRTANAYPAWAYGPLGGAVLAVGLAFAYAGLFFIYAFIRASLFIVRVHPDTGTAGTIVAYAFALAIPILVITVIMALPAAVLGLVTMPIVTRVVAWCNPRHTEGRAILAGVATCSVLAFALLIACQRLLGFTLGDVATNLDTFLLWLAIPAVIFVSAGGVVGQALNNRPCQ